MIISTIALYSDCRNLVVSDEHMPVIQIYIREELYKELIKLCEQLGVNEKDFIREALEKWLEARKNVRPGEEKA